MGLESQVLSIIQSPGQLRIQQTDMQIKIFAEYRVMLPRPRLICQEPGLRPIASVSDR